MPLPYENTTSGEKALSDLQKILRGFNVTSFGSMVDYSTGELLVQFQYNRQRVEVRASMSGYAEAWKREHPYSHRMKRTRSQWEEKALSVASLAVYSMVRDWVKGQITAVETGLLTFESAFMPHMLLPNGQRVIDRINDMKMLEPPE